MDPQAPLPWPSAEHRKEDFPIMFHVSRKKEDTCLTIPFGFPGKPERCSFSAEAPPGVGGTGAPASAGKRSRSAAVAHPPPIPFAFWCHRLGMRNGMNLVRPLEETVGHGL